MELRAYLRTLASKWWIVLFVFIITYGATLAFTFSQKPIYQSMTTYVVKLNSLVSNDRDLASAVDILSRRTEIATTYTMVANSGLIKRAAADALKLPAEQRIGILVSSEIVPGTNVLEIMVQSSDPVQARDFANAVGAQMVTYSHSLYETYTLEQLDLPSVPDAPIKPNKPLNLALGAVMGLILGAGMALLAAYLQAPPESVASVSVFDEETGVYNQRYLTMRLRQELTRAQRNNYPLALALMNVDHRGALARASEQIRRMALRRVAHLLMGQLRDEDTIAYFGGTVFALLLPDLGGEAAKQLLEQAQMVVSANPIALERDNIVLDLQCSAGIVAYSKNTVEEDVEADHLLEQATRSLKESETATYGKVLLSAEDQRLTTPDVRSVMSV